jgi:hypothetical protein
LVYFLFGDSVVAVCASSSICSEEKQDADYNCQDWVSPPVPPLVQATPPEMKKIKYAKHAENDFFS